MEKEKKKLTRSQEALRKSIHLFYSLSGFLYFYFDRTTMLYILGVLSIAMIIVDLVRSRMKPVQSLYVDAFGKILREHEFNSKKLALTGGTYLVIATFLCVLFFPKEIAIKSIFIIIFCDSAAAIVGKSFGTMKVWGKTIEGSFAFVAVGLIVIFFTPNYTLSTNEYYIAASSLLLTSAVELLPVKFDDNIFIPLFFGGMYMLLLKIFIM